MSIYLWCCIALSGALGTLCRCAVSLWAKDRFGLFFPYGTLIVNVLGSFLIGFAATFIAYRIAADLQKGAGLMIIVGFLGAFTTFSSFSLETFGLFERGEVLFALVNVCVNVCACLLAVVMGQFLAKSIWG